MGADGATILSHFEAENDSILLGGILFLLGSLAFLWFLGALRAVAAPLEGRAMRLTGTMFATGLAFIVSISAAWAPKMSLALSLEDGGSSVAPEAAQAMFLGGDGFFVVADLMLAGFLLALTVLTLTLGLLPKWLGWVSALMAVILLIPPIGWSVLIFVFPIWLLIAALILYRSQAGQHSGISPTA